MFSEVIVKGCCYCSFFDACLGVTDCLIFWVFHVEVKVGAEGYFLRHREDNLIAFVDGHAVWEVDVFVFNFKVDVLAGAVSVSALFKVHVNVWVFDGNCSTFF